MRRHESMALLLLLGVLYSTRLVLVEVHTTIAVTKMPCMPGEDPHITLVILPKSGPRTFSEEFAAKLSLPVVSAAGDVLLPSSFEPRPPRLGRLSNGRCRCNKRALILARCAGCAREDLSVAQEVAQLAEEEGMEEEESEDLPPDMSATARFPADMPAAHCAAVAAAAAEVCVATAATASS